MQKTKKLDITLSSGAALLPSHDLIKFITKIPQSKLPKKEMKKKGLGLNMGMCVSSTQTKEGDVYMKIYIMRTLNSAVVHLGRLF